MVADLDIQDTELNRLRVVYHTKLVKYLTTVIILRYEFS